MSTPERIGAIIGDGPRTRPAADDQPANSVLEGDEDAQAARALRTQTRTGWENTVPRRFWTARPTDFEPPVRDELAAWSANDERPNLVLFGAVGVGKSHGAVAACRQPFADGEQIMFMPVGELLDHIDWRRPDSHDWLERFCTVDRLIVDDLGAERGNEWTGERLYLIVNRRWLDGLPTVATTNLTTDELTEQVGERTYSRLAHGAVALALTGKDRRRG